MAKLSPVPLPVRDRPLPEDVRAHLNKILKWTPFARATRLSRFLRYTVEQALGECPQQLKEYVIATEVFDKPKSFDPRLDPIVRVEARRLRTRLREYYESAGRNDPIVIRFPSRGYRPTAGFRRKKPVQQPGLITLAVLPFLDLSPQGDQQYLCTGFTVELINALAGTQGLRVASRSNSFRYGGKAIDVRRVGQELKVGYLLEGSVRTDEQRFRVTVQLTGCEDGFEIWSRSYDGDKVNVLMIQQAIAQSVSDSLQAQLTGSNPVTGQNRVRLVKGGRPPVSRDGGGEPPV